MTLNEHSASAADIRAEAERKLAEIQAAGDLPAAPRPVRDGIADLATLLVASRLRALRKARGWSLAVACTHLSSIGVAALSRIERGERQITISDLAELAGGYGVSIADLVAPGDICDACGQEIPR